MSPRELNQQIMAGQHNRSEAEQDVVDSTSLADEEDREEGREARTEEAVRQEEVAVIPL